jgi:hypothetical protein
MAVRPQDRRVENLPDLVIPSSGDASNFLSADQFGRYESITIYAPGTLTGTISVQVLGNPEADETLDASWQDLESPPGTGVTIAADKAITISPLNAIALRLESSGTEAAQRTFKVTGRLQRVASP